MFGISISSFRQRRSDFEASFFSLVTLFYKNFRWFLVAYIKIPRFFLRRFIIGDSPAFFSFEAVFSFLMEELMTSEYGILVKEDQRLFSLKLSGYIGF